MFRMTREIYEVLKKEDLKVFTEESDKASEVWLQFGIKSGGSYKIKFVSFDDDHDVAVRVMGLVTVRDEARKEPVLQVVNRLNNTFRFVKFVLDDDGDVNLEYDYLVRCPDPTASVLELIVRITSIVDQAYPDLMRAIWG